MVAFNRAKFLFPATALILAVLVSRLFVIQLLSGNNLSARAHKIRTITKELPAPRGFIYDRNHRILVFNKPYMTVYAYPNQITNKRSTASQLAQYIDQTPAKILGLLNNSKYKYYSVLAYHLSYTSALKLERLHLKGIYFRTKQELSYPQGSLAAQVLGFTGQGDRGLAGLEDEYNTVLAGRPGSETIAVDGSGRLIPSTRQDYIAPRPGENLVLTMDENIQYYAERELSRLQKRFHPDWSTIIVMNPATGGLLALAGSPTFNPALWSGYPEKVWGSDPAVLNDIEPGSVFKIVTAAAAIEDGVASPATRYSFPGYITVDGIRIWDWNFAKDRNRSLTWAMEDSYNPVFSALALKLGAQNFNKYVRGFGFGQPTGIDLPGEAAGILLPVGRVTPLDLATMGFGQGIAVTPLQMITAASAIANGGFLPVPHLVRAITGPGNSVVKTFSPAPSRQVVSQSTAIQVMKMLRKVVTLGTGQPAAVPGYRVAGKTGTAQIPGPGGYRKGAYVASFLGFAPYPDPRVAILVVVDHPRGGKYYGDEVAAPAFRRLTGRIMAYLHIPPVATSLPAQSRTRVAGVVTVPDLRGFPTGWAQSELQYLGLKNVLTGSGNVVQSQEPPPSSRLNPGGAVRLVLTAPSPGSRVVVPNLTGLPIKTAALILGRLGLTLDPAGSGLAGRQNPAPGSLADPKSTVQAWFTPYHPWLH
ncbi:MAG: penicillin-binding transpeptidase domain-containing protein [Peptococcaceae bacterium]|jgi:stage V sporulation protein D (sporulation-specific penicillin-binding protein)|nr:penicillin-binding transpeptidase domain-containing protein [Peptococcaceae bacterium]